MSYTKAFNFTIATISLLAKPPKGKRSYYRDTKEKGLILDVRASGTKSFYLYKKIHGRPVKMLLGHFPDISIENARKSASVLKGDIASGKNPQHEKQRIRNEMTFEQLFQEYLNRYSKLHKKTWREDEKEIPQYVSHFLKRKISEIKQSDIQKAHAKIGIDNGKCKANKILCRIKAIYNKAIEWGWQGINPAKGIKKFREKTRERFIQPNELSRFFQALNEEPNQNAKDYVWLLLLTGSRKSKIGAMDWAHIHWHQKEWHIPETKNGDTVIVPLVPEAIELLQARWQIAIEEEQRTGQKPKFVFGSSNSKTGHISCPSHRWKEILKQAKLTDFRMHDLRRTLGSYQAITGASLTVIGKSLGHRSSQATMIYARLHLDPVRESVEKATSTMFSLSKSKVSPGQLLPAV